MSGSWILHLQHNSYDNLLWQHRLPVTQADEPGGPTLLYALKVPEGPEVLQVVQMVQPCNDMQLLPFCALIFSSLALAYP